jgi:hypothetical protein
MRVIGLKLLFWPVLASPCWFFLRLLLGLFLGRTLVLSFCTFISPLRWVFILVLCLAWFHHHPKGPQKFGSSNKLKKVSMMLIIDNYLTLKQEWSCKNLFHFLVQFTLNLHWFKFKSLKLSCMYYKWKRMINSWNPPP